MTMGGKAWLNPLSGIVLPIHGYLVDINKRMAYVIGITTARYQLDHHPLDY